MKNVIKAVLGIALGALALFTVLLMIDTNYTKKHEYAEDEDDEYDLFFDDDLD